MSTLQDQAESKASIFKLSLSAAPIPTPMHPGFVKIKQNKETNKKFLSCAGFWT